MPSFFLLPQPESSLEITVEQDFYFSNRNHLLLTEIAQSLLALEQNARAFPTALQKLFPDVQVESLSLYVDKLESGSLFEKIKYRLRGALQQQIEDHSGVQLGNLSHIPDERKKQIVSWLIVALVVYGLKEAADSFKPEAPRPHMEQTVHITLLEGELLTGIDTATLERALKSSLEETPNASQGAVNFARPAKKDPEAWLSINEQIVLTSDALHELPSAVPEQQPREKSIDLRDTLIIIRATDRDSGKKGWGATIPEFSTRRLRISVAPGINLDALAQHDVVIGNVTVLFGVDAQGNIVRPHAHIYSVDLGDHIASGP